MRTKSPQIQISEFVELVAFPLLQSKNPIFDIIIEEDININNYCDTLVKKVCILKNTKYSGFIDYQTNLVADSLLWIENLEELISNNEKLLESNCAKIKIHSFFNLLEKKRSEIESSSVKKNISKILDKHINANSEDRIFSFHSLKKQLELCKDDKERIILITKEKHEYKQATIISKSSILAGFDKLCTKEIEQIRDLATLNTTSENNINNNKTKLLQIKKIKINCNLNQFIDIYFQLSHELLVDGKPFIDGSINDIVASIVNSFVDKNGNEISPETVKTILTPSRTDKRPKNHRKIDINRIV